MDRSAAQEGVYHALGLVTVLLVFVRIALIHREQRSSTRKLSLESDRLATIEAIQRDLAAGLDLQAFLQSACERAHALVGGGVTVSVLSGDELIVMATAGISGIVNGQTLARRSLAARAIAEDRVLIALDAETDPRVDSQLVARTGSRSLLAAPLHFAGTPIGAINFASRRAGAFAGRDARTVSLIASLVSVAVNRDSEFAAHRALSEIVESSSEAVVREDLERRILFWNHGAEQLYGYSAEEMLGRRIDLIIPPEQRAAKSAQLERLLRGELLAPVEVDGVARDGRRVLTSLSLTAVRDVNGRIVGVTGTGRDLTATRELEEQLHQAQKMEAVGRLAGGIAHDFNNLLTAIEGYGSLLVDLVEGDETQHHYAEQIVEAAKRSAELTQQLLAYSRKQLLQPAILDPNVVVEEIERLLARMVGEDVVVTCELDANVGRVHVDRSRLGQILMNLAVNARDAMPRGGQLSISTSRVELTGLGGVATGGAPAGAYVRIAVRDTGVGMDEETVKRIFEPFFTTKGEEGTGLGLATVYGTVKQSGGYIGVRTAPGRGTTFTVYLPVCTEVSLESESFATAA